MTQHMMAGGGDISTEFYFLFIHGPAPVKFAP
jgi:hypothetical protein